MSSSSSPKDHLDDGEDEFQHTHVSRMQSLQRILTDTYGVEDKSLVDAIVALGEATAHIAFHLTNYVEHNYAGSQNLSGDEQLELDIHCDKAVFAAVQESGVYSTVASEETPQETTVGTGPFSLGCDPLDGSSIIDANFSVGSIYGIWPGSTLIGRTGREQVAAAVALYGPRTLLCIALAESKQVFEVTLVRNRSEYEVSRPRITIEPNGKIFAPGNLRATTDHKEYNALLQYWLDNRYQLRYSGGMVPDVYHIFAKSKGIFTNASSKSAKAKLRLLYEVAPMGLIVECAGGSAIDESKDQSVLDIVIDHTDHRMGVCFGSTNEVAKYKEYMFVNP
jgi:sedoheptulose-bisphosphatase